MGPTHIYTQLGISCHVKPNWVHGPLLIGPLKSPFHFQKAKNTNQKQTCQWENEDESLNSISMPATKWFEESLKFKLMMLLISAITSSYQSSSTMIFYIRSWMPVYLSQQLLNLAIFVWHGFLIEYSRHCGDVFIEVIQSEWKRPNCRLYGIRSSN